MTDRYTDAQMLYMICLALDEGLSGIRTIDLPDFVVGMISEHWGTANEDVNPEEVAAVFAELEQYIPEHLREEGN